MIQFTKLSLAFGDRDILKEVSFSLNKGEKAALAGANGAGKSTLLKIASGKIPFDSGDYSLTKGMRIGYLPQSGLQAQKAVSLWDEVEKAFNHFQEIEKERDQIGEELKKNNDDDRIRALLESHHRLQEQLDNSAYYHREQAIGMTLKGLGFTPSDYTKEAQSFSGGWQMRIALAKVLLENPDFLLLDEPTNYLDLEATQWLGQFLKNYTGGFLLVSHDRYFLDHTVNRVVEIFNGNLKSYKGNYTSYQSKREMELQTLVAEFKKQQEEIEKLEDFIRRFRSNASKAKLVQSRVKQLEKIDPIVLPEGIIPMKLRFPEPPHSGKNVLHLQEVAKSYGDHRVLNGINMDLLKGEKLVITGINGAGKSTLMRLLSGQDSQFSGTIKWGTDVKIGYFSQDHEKHLNAKKSLLEELEENAPTELIPRLRNLLGAFLFRGDDVYKQVDILSGGEKNRLSLLKLLLSPANLLLLDEPTNHLDLTSKEVLLSALKEYTGTLIFVSHDQYFIENLATKVIELKEGKYRIFPGDYAYYQQRLSQESLNQESMDQESLGTAASAKEKENVSDRKLDHQEQKRIKNLKRKLEKEAQTVQEQIHTLEEELQTLTKELEKEEVYSNPEKSRMVAEKQGQVEKSIEEALLKWEEIETELQGL